MPCNGETPSPTQAQKNYKHSNNAALIRENVLNESVMDEKILL